MNNRYKQFRQILRRPNVTETSYSIGIYKHYMTGHYNEQTYNLAKTVLENHRSNKVGAV